MDKSSKSHRNADSYILVLKKLKPFLLGSASLSSDLEHYSFDWDKKQPHSVNMMLVEEEDKVATYFLDIGVIEGKRNERNFESDKNRAVSYDDEGRNWDRLEDIDPAFREYGWEILIARINPEKYKEELFKFGLKDTGLEVVEINKDATVSKTIKQTGDFTAHRDGTVCFRGTPILFKPSVGFLVHRLVVASGETVHYQELVDAIWNEDNDNESYLENRANTRAKIGKQISSMVSEANKTLFAYDNKRHIISRKNTSYSFVA